ncbi:MAG: manganese efflux pump [Clostridia bacterium]|nr:manganese efflux pump [Clostridia bacterium]
MQVYEILLLAVALAMDACAVGMTDGMTNPKMPLKRTLLIGGFFGFFQFLMPLIGYFITGIIANAFLGTFEKISAWISFGLLVFLGGKMLFDCIWEKCQHRKLGEETCDCACKELSIGKLCMQAIATSIDALAVGVTLQMAAISEGGLALGVWGATLTIGVITFMLVIGAVYIGKFVGNKLADKAGFFGGLVLIGIGVKILVESFL